ncbi:MAG TPA: CxxC-x17-CxxC domain-containing protein [Candidatus Eisenbacteria bacterium]|jgi:CxxC-x17-CxxC domain-containing protein|nr:CxxC-x17-CxxC domain-containing protein [Candidatus Eisenbacteria bacterium]
MKPFKRDGRFSTGKKFGGGSFARRAPSAGGFGGGEFAKPLFKSTCAECGQQCEVPFRPNGSKPVLCHSCFKKDGGGFSKPSFGDRRPSYGRAPAAGGSQDTAKLELQIAGLETKIDRILREIEAMKEGKEAA